MQESYPSIKKHYTSFLLLQQFRSSLWCCSITIGSSWRAIFPRGCHYIFLPFSAPSASTYLWIPRDPTECPTFIYIKVLHFDGPGSYTTVPWRFLFFLLFFYSSSCSLYTSIYYKVHAGLTDWHQPFWTKSSKRISIRSRIFRDKSFSFGRTWETDDWILLLSSVQFKVTVHYIQINW